MDKRKARRLDRIGLNQSKHIGLDQEDQTEQSRADERKKSGEGSIVISEMSGRFFGCQDMMRQGEAVF